MTPIKDALIFLSRWSMVIVGVALTVAELVVALITGSPTRFLLGGGIGILLVCLYYELLLIERDQEDGDKEGANR